MKKNLSAILRIIKQLVYVLSPKQKRQSVLVFITMSLTSGLELLGVSSIYPLLQLMMTPDEVRDKWYIGWIYTIVPNMEYKHVLIVFCILIIFVFIFKNAFAIYFSYIQIRFAEDFNRDASTEMLRKYLRRPYEYFVNTNSSIILRGIGQDTSSVHSILLSFFQAMGEVMTIVLLGIFLFSIDVLVSTCALVLAGLCFLFIVGVFKNRMKNAGRLAREAISAKSTCGYQAINGIKEIAVLDRRELFIKRYEIEADKAAKSGVISGVIGACPDRILEGVCISGFIGIVCVRLMISSDVSSFIPVMGSFAMGAFKILPSISKLSTRINSMVYNQFGLQSCYENFKEAERIEKEERSLGVERTNEEECITECTLKKDGFEKGKAKNENNLLGFRDFIRIENIYWHYQNSKVDVLHGLSLKILKGESVALVGPSGAGKTTLADIIMGLLKPQMGSVFMDEHDIYLIPQTWHKQIGYVPQSVYLIDDTIRANVAFGLPKNMVSDDKVWDALEQAQFKTFVEHLPNGLDTIVGERGVKFSGGQRQRIALARALYEAPEILVLDEATSALDNETEAAVMESIEALQGHKTLIIIAHRLTTIKNCDRIYKIENGIAEETTYEELTGE